MSSSSHDGTLTPRSQLASNCFDDLLDFIIADVASECHRIARLGLDRSLNDEEEELRLSSEAAQQLGSSSTSTSNNVTNGGESNANVYSGGVKNVVDIFGQRHPPIASEIFECMNCARPIVAGRFAPHLEKCMGKGRKTRTKATRSSTVGRNRHSSHGSPVSVYAPYSNPAPVHRLPNGTTDGVGEEYAFEE